MENEIKQLINKSAEVNILLNSNMEDVVEYIKQTSEHCNVMKQDVNKSLDDIINVTKNASNYMTKEAERLVTDNRLNNEKINHKLETAILNNEKQLIDNFEKAQKFVETNFSNMGSTLQQIKNTQKTQNDGMLTENTKNFNTIISNQSKLSDMASEINKELKIVKNENHTLNKLINDKFNELNIALLNETKSIRKRQAIYFTITILIIILLSLKTFI